MLGQKLRYLMSRDSQVEHRRLGENIWISTNQSRTPTDLFTALLSLQVSFSFQNLLKADSSRKIALIWLTSPPSLREMYGYEQRLTENVWLWARAKACLGSVRDIQHIISFEGVLKNILGKPSLYITLKASLDKRQIWHLESLCP